eukprot:Lithocolla_globosa_v1_NODE_4604_length_1402_cov_25.225687.p3 type:complete len:102 gc:universal NODE_4604_length_1402_cov_25.225687:187-492(+)
MGRITTCPSRATGRCLIACMPRMAHWGVLMIGVPIMEPNTPPLEMVKVPPASSSTLILPSRALAPSMAISDSMSLSERSWQPLSTGVTNPLGVATATEMST